MKRWQADLTLGMIALIWGSTFVLVKNALDTVEPLNFLGPRFLVAVTALVILFWRRVRHTTRQELIAGGMLGLFLASGYTFQTIGLQTTTTAKAGFITGLSVVIVPILATLLLRRPPGRWPTVGILAATVGLACLSLNADLSVQTGDLWVMACAVSFALHIVAVSRYSPGMDAVRLAIVQIGLAGILCTAGTFIFESPTLDLSGQTWFAIIFTGLLATALVFSLQVIVQRYTTPTHTALLFSLEPVFAAFFGWWWASENLGARELIGCGLILLGMIIAEVGAAPEAEPVVPVIDCSEAGAAR